MTVLESWEMVRVEDAWTTCVVLGVFVLSLWFVAGQHSWVVMPIVAFGEVVPRANGFVLQLGWHAVRTRGCHYGTEGRSPLERGIPRSARDRM
jgi:hypothetical protein